MIAPSSPAELPESFLHCRSIHEIKFDGYRAVQRAACAVRASGLLRQRRAASISASVAPLLLAHISAADAEYLAT